MALLAHHRRQLGRSFWVVVAPCVALTFMAAIAWPQKDGPPSERHVPRQVRDNKFVSSDTCRSCHPDHYASWHASYHRTMTQIVTPETVVAPFDNKTHSFGDETFRFERRGDEFYIHFTVKSPDGSLKASPPLRVVMSTGSHHYQIYWVEGVKDGQPIEMPTYYNIAEKRWILKRQTLMEPPGKANTSGHWNSHCIRCHSVNGIPAYDPKTQSFDSQVAEFGISCEACHGPAEDHVRWHRNPLNRYRQHFGDEPDPTIVNPANCSTKVSTHICARCHGSYSQDFDAYVANGFLYLPGGDLEQEVNLYDFDNPLPGKEDYVESLFWADGTCRVGGDEYNAHRKSPCFERGELSCLSCHSMHDSDPNDQLARGMDGNQACLQCHSSFQDRIEEHTHHRPGTSGSQCYNCHMPHTTWALSTAMRSHRIDSPSAETSIRTGRPNACNLCHLDKTLKWSAEKLSEWYSKPEVEVNEDQEQIAASLLWLLKGNALQRAIVAWHIGFEPSLDASGDGWQAPLLAQLLDDPYPQVRFAAGRSLRRLPGFDEFSYDFIGPETQRREAQKRAIEVWRPSRWPTGKDRGRQILIEPTGALRQDIIERLLKLRDDSPISIPE